MCSRWCMSSACCRSTQQFSVHHAALRGQPCGVALGCLGSGWVQGRASRSQVCVLWMYQIPADVTSTEMTTAAAGRRLPVLMHGAGGAVLSSVDSQTSLDRMWCSMLCCAYRVSLNRQHACWCHAVPDAVLTFCNYPGLSPIRVALLSVPGRSDLGYRCARHGSGRCRLGAHIVSTAVTEQTRPPAHETMAAAQDGSCRADCCHHMVRVGQYRPCLLAHCVCTQGGGICRKSSGVQLGLGPNCGRVTEVKIRLPSCYGCTALRRRS